MNNIVKFKYLKVVSSLIQYKKWRVTKMSILGKIQMAKEIGFYLAQEFKENRSGSMGIGYVIGAVILFYIMSATVPDAITTFKDANTTGWTTGEAAMWGLITLMFIIGIVVAFLPKGLGR